MKIVITCAGSEARWKNYMGVPKQMVPLFGIPLLQRTVQEINKIFPDSDVYVSIQDQSKEESYVVDGKYDYYVVPQFNEGDSALKSIVPLFKEFNDNFLVLMGDVAFSRDCIDRIYNVVKEEQSNGSNELKVFGRKYGSKITSHKNGELFAYYIPSEVIIKLIEAIEIVDKYYSLRLLNRKIGWEVISCYHSKSKSLSEIIRLRRRHNYPSSSFVNIDDETDDFDYPDQYNNYVNEISRSNYWRVMLKCLRRWVKKQLLLIYFSIPILRHVGHIFYGNPNSK